MTLVYLGATLLWFVAMCIAVALCKSAARGDKQLDETPPSPLAEHFAQAEASKLRTYHRLAIRELSPRDQ